MGRNNNFRSQYWLHYRVDDAMMYVERIRSITSLDRAKPQVETGLSREAYIRGVFQVKGHFKWA